MMCFRDRTYCSPKTCTGKCGREFTDKDHKDAVKWWDGEDYPLAIADFCTEHREQQLQDKEQTNE